MEILDLIERTQPLFSSDVNDYEEQIREIVGDSRFLVIGGAGSIGQAVVKELFSRNPSTLHVVDLSENGLVELVRDLRSSYGYINGDFRTFAVDFGQQEFEAVFSSYGPYDFVVNLAALKHVRSERDPFTLMRLTRVNILNTDRSLRIASEADVGKYFAVSSDKATNPVNMMGASKRIMELFLSSYSGMLNVSTARFANVAFSNGSLLDGFRFRLRKHQPLAAPNDVKRYFVTEKEAGQLCLLSITLGKDGEIFFPKAPEELHMVSFADIAERFLRASGFEPFLCETEEDARAFLSNEKMSKQWPLYVFGSDTTGEKPFEEFYENEKNVDFDSYKNIGIIELKNIIERKKLNTFVEAIDNLLSRGSWTKADLLSAYSSVLPDFIHEEKGRSLDERM